MDIAERKITEKDYIGATVFANNAQNLFSHLDGLKQFLIMVEVYISGEKKICGEPDWYGILGVEHSADDEAIRKHYNNLAIMLHPDKNKCTGAEAAFKLLSEAWSLLSDQMCRSLYNFRKQQSDHKSSTIERWIPLYYPNLNGILSVRKDVVLGAIARTKHGADMDRLLMDSNSFISSIQTENGAFWTKCEECQIKYQYERFILTCTCVVQIVIWGFLQQRGLRLQVFRSPSTSHLTTNVRVLKIRRQTKTCMILLLG